MLLRRITKHVKNENWFAVFIDFVIVVIGVLFAFQVTEWNNQRANHTAEYRALERLIIEYEENLTILAITKTGSVNTSLAADKLITMIAPEPDPNINDKNIGKTILDVLINPKFEPNLGVTKSLQSSGVLTLIQNQDIHRELSSWQSDMEVINDWQEIERMHGEELVLGLLYEYISLPNITHHASNAKQDANPSKMTSDYQGLFSSKRFEGLLDNRSYNYQSLLESMTKLEAKTHNLIKLFKARKRELE